MELASSVDTRASTAPGSPGTYPISWGPKRLLLLLFPCHKAHALCWPTGAMKGVLVPILILWVGCCSGEALAKQGLSTREFIAPPAPAALPIVQPPPSSSRSSNDLEGPGLGVKESGIHHRLTGGLWWPNRKWQGSWRPLTHDLLVHVPSFLPQSLRCLILCHNLIECIPNYILAHVKPGLEFLHPSHNRLHAEGIHRVSFLGLHTSLAELLLDHNHL
ncbi:uncharacterized protein LOC115069685 isoform X3 [Nannospalax galili]|uniref:uncharacterized protein LOC115069685 isoform X3 n=1 Tax=Nannospalax galili TaxID=1026970 RepID=UPI00111BEF0C|nr:uncharacterized protein LOC115069685 isoform X3 [Nannospalax galili]